MLAFVVSKFSLFRAVPENFGALYENIKLCPLGEKGYYIT
jgi:hypothetical protein